MKPSRFLLFVIFLLLSATMLSACSGGAVSSSWPGVSADDDTAYMAYNQVVFAINLTNGTEKWRYPVEKPTAATTFYAPPALTYDGQLIAGSYDRKLYSLNPTNGQVNWIFDKAKDHYIATPLVTEEGIYAPNADGKLYALDFAGKERWIFTSKKPLWARPVTDGDCHCVVVSSMDRHVYRLDADTGKVQWTSPDLGGALVASPTFGPDETIFIGTFANEMVALNATDGAVKWRFQTAGWIWSSVALNSDTIYFGDLKGSFYALEASSGKELWKIQPNGAITGAPLLAEDAIYFTSETGTLHAVNKDGSPLWNQAIGGKLYAPVIMAGDMLLTAPVGGKMLLAALDENGVQKWSFAPEK